MLASTTCSSTRNVGSKTVRSGVYAQALRVVEQPLHRALGLTDEELDRICELLERDPNHFELAVFSLLWSEHCGYKHSARLLKRLPSQGERVLQGPGENAGVLDLGDGEAVAFKVESHNHPSAVEPFQGAATGVGGILRDVIAMGARPIALLDGLRFAEPGLDVRARRLGHRALRKLRRVCRPSAAKRSSTRAMPATASSTRCASGCFRASACCGRGRRPWAVRCSCTGRRPDETGSVERAFWPARSSARRTRTSGRASRSAIPSPARS